MKKSHPHQESQNPETQKPEPLYAQVDKSRKRGPRTQSPEDLQAANRSQPTLQEDSPYNTPRTEAAGYDTPPSQRPQETVYAPQNPLEGTIYAPQYPLGSTHAAVRRGSRTPSPDKLVDPYAVVNLATGETESEQRRNPLYDSPSGSDQDLRHPPRPEEHLYAEIDPRTEVRRAPYKPVETIYTTLGMGAEGGQESQQRENPLYEGVGRATTPPPRTQKDVVTTKLLQHTDFQYGVRETQEWCTVVYGNPHALNQQLSEILENPKGAEKVLWSLAANPESVGRLAGSKVLGIKSPDRKEAEEGFRHLCSALERHIDKTQRLHKDFTRDLERGQKYESPERSPEHRRHHHHHRHARGQEQNSPEHSPQRQRKTEIKGMAHAM
ncbi:BID domain-containing T4SS effector [Bartonella sp. B1098]|uniref:BID domain-containing T4SS effector n=1 Tax=Bartonella sp. B1098 TaxID=2911421 RepID=UPI0020C22814|nr:BID domain-containing T4SS effector [Bartonella sp. B1098]